MKYVVYCDESRHNGAQVHRYMGIGSLWVPEPVKPYLTKDVRALTRACGIGSEVKWSKTSERVLAGYTALVDYFVQAPLIFRVIVVDQARVDIDRFHAGDWELGFYKFYYEVLEKWITPGNEYLILLDFKQNKGAGRYGDLKRILRNKFVGQSTISDLTIIDSAQSPLAQVCDLLTGAVAAACCTDLRAGSAKLKLVQHMVSKLDLGSLTIPTPTPAISKFNIFRIQLRP